MDKVTLLLILLLSLIGCGDDNGHHTPQPPPICEFTYSEWGECQSDNTQVRTFTSKQPEGCIGEPILIQSCTYIPPLPEPTDCCPDQNTSLLCSQCTSERPCKTEHPDLAVSCSGNLYTVPFWYLHIQWGRIMIEVSRPDLSCCPLEKTGISIAECNETKMCNGKYLGDTEWFLYGKPDGTWYIYNYNFYKDYRIINK